MIIQSQEIKTASKCLKYYNFSKDSILKPEAKHLIIIKNVIKYAYAHTVKTNFKPEWKKILHWVDKQVFKNIDIDDERAFKDGKKLSENCLSILYKWYTDFFIEEKGIGYPDIPLEYRMGQYVIQNTFFIIRATKIPTFIEIVTEEKNKIEHFNNLLYRTNALILSNNLESKEINIEIFTIGNTSKFQKDVIRLKEKDQDRTKKACAAISGLIKYKADYPSINEQCISCPFKKRCFL